jgi:hypothetical protein
MYRVRAAGFGIWLSPPFPPMMNSIGVCQADVGRDWIIGGGHVTVGI